MEVSSLYTLRFCYPSQTPEDQGLGCQPGNSVNSYRVIITERQGRCSVRTLDKIGSRDATVQTRWQDTAEMTTITRGWCEDAMRLSPRWWDRDKMAAATVRHKWQHEGVRQD